MASSAYWAYAGSYVFNSKMRCGAVRCGAVRCGAVRHGAPRAGLCPFPRWGRLGWGPAAVALQTLFNQGSNPRFCPPLPQGEGGGEGQRRWQKCCFCAGRKPWVVGLWPLQPARSLPKAQAGTRPGGRGTFLCLAKEKCQKEPRPDWLRPPALRFGGNLRCSHPAGSCSNSPSA